MSRKANLRANLIKGSLLKQIIALDNEFKQAYNNTADLRDSTYITEAEKQLIFKTLIPNITQHMLQKDQKLTSILDIILNIQKKHSNSNWANSTFEKIQGISQEDLTRIIRDIISELFIDAINNRIVL